MQTCEPHVLVRAYIIYIASVALIKAGPTVRFSPSILLTYGSMSTSCRCWCVCAWYNLSVESSLIDTQTPSPSQANCLTWLSFLGWTSKDFYKSTTFLIFVIELIKGCDFFSQPWFLFEFYVFSIRKAPQQISGAGIRKNSRKGMKIIHWASLNSRA